MNILIIPDIHLKTKIFDMAQDILDRKFEKFYFERWNEQIDEIVFLGDYFDDFHSNYKDYERMSEAFLKFLSNKSHPKTTILAGNHDYAYYANKCCTGHRPELLHIVLDCLNKVDKDFTIRVMYKVDDVIFSHAGLSNTWANKTISLFGAEDNIESIISTTNILGRTKHYRLWEEDSPLWVRPQEQDKVPEFRRIKLYKPDDYFQVVGHTPVEMPTQENNLLSLDTFSTYSDGTLYGNEELVIFNTKTHKYITIGRL